MAVIYVHPRCGTCRKALAWLTREYPTAAIERLDLLESPPSREQLAEMAGRASVPLRRFFNTSGQSWRAGGFRERIDTMTEDEMLDALAADPMLLRRPALDLGDRALVGFVEDDWRAALEAGGRGAGS
jgi:arsenate reductase